MHRPANETVYYQNDRGIRVTGRLLTTRYKHEALAPIQSVQVGREPLQIAGLAGGGLALFAGRFGDLLYRHEQVLLVCVGLAVIGAGCCLASLRIGQYTHERTVLWASIWTVTDVRQAITKARQAESLYEA